MTEGGTRLGTGDAATSGNPRLRAEQLLEAWRRADRALADAVAAGDGVREAVIDVVTAWLSYQSALNPAPDEFVLVADDERQFVGVSANARALLGYEPDELRGRRVDDIVAQDEAATVPDRWAQFRATGREVARIPLRAKNGTVLLFEYDARPNFPVPGCHASRLKVAERTPVEDAPPSS